MNVPFLDLKAQYLSIKEEIDQALNQVLESCAFAGGPFVARFEKDFAAFCQSEHCVGVGSGTEALWLTLLAFGVGPGDEVITVPNTFIATAEAISFCGATPVFVDIDARTYTMDPQKLRECIEQYYRLDETTNRLVNRSTKARLKAIIPVHLFGQPADMDPLMETARANNLLVIEDACQAHGAEYKGKRAGSIGDAGCFSFYPGKNLGAYGDAGAVVTNHDKLHETITMLRDHGQERRYNHREIGWNARMDGMQSAVLSVKLKHLPKWNNARRRKAKLYNQCLAGFEEIATPMSANSCRHVYHIFPIRITHRDSLLAHLHRQGISAAIHYPTPIHLQPAYKSLGHRNGNFPVAERYAAELVSLPMYPELTEMQIAYVSEVVEDFLQNTNHCV